jgi:hypothetical protein
MALPGKLQKHVSIPREVDIVRPAQSCIRNRSHLGVCSNCFRFFLIKSHLKRIVLLPGNVYLLNKVFTSTLLTYICD